MVPGLSVRFLVGTLAVAMWAAPGVAQEPEDRPDSEPAENLNAPAEGLSVSGLNGPEVGFSDAFRSAHSPPMHPPEAAETTDWAGNLSLSLGAGLVYELGDWPSAVLFGAASTEAAPGVAAIVGVRYGLLSVLELNVEVALRYLYFGDIAANDTPSTPFAENVSVLSPSLALTARLRPASRFYLGAGLGVGFGWLFGEATSRDGPLVPFGDMSGAVGELRGEAGFLLGPTARWDVGARLRFVGYPRVAGTTTLAVALELALTVPVWP